MISLKKIGDEYIVNINGQKLEFDSWQKLQYYLYQECPKIFDENYKPKKLSELDFDG